MHQQPGARALGARPSQKRCKTSAIRQEQRGSAGTGGEAEWRVREGQKSGGRDEQQTGVREHGAGHTGRPLSRPTSTPSTRPAATWRGVWPSTSLSLRSLSGCPASSSSSATTLSTSACGHSSGDTDTAGRAGWIGASRGCPAAAGCVPAAGSVRAALAVAQQQAACVQRWHSQRARPSAAAPAGPRGAARP